MVVALVFDAVFALSAAGLGWWAVRALDRNTALADGERLAMAFGIGALAVHLGVFVIGPVRLDGVSMGALAAALVAAAVPGLAAMPWRRWGSGLAPWASSLRREPVLALMWLVLAGTVAAALLQGMAPPNDYDSLMYHLSLPRRDVEIGRMTPGWEWHVYPFYPALAEDLFRFGLVLGGEKSVQMLHGLFGISGALLTAGLARRWGGGSHARVLAALMFVSVRAVVWEMATCEVDIALASYTAAAVVAYMAWRDRGGFGSALLFGIALAGAINTKYHGFPLALGFAPAILWDLGRRRPLGQLVAGPLATLVLIMPHMVRNWWFTGNPVFPLFNRLITGGPNFLEFADEGGTGRGLVDLMTTPWSMFIAPTLHFDGMVMGAPYLLALMPLAWFARRSMRHALPALGLLTVYYIEWFHLLSQQVRFLMPVYPVMAALAAVGATEAWRRLRGWWPGATAFAVMAGALALNQALFVGVYAAIRLPAALGMMSAADYHTRTPTLGGAHYLPCTWVAEHLGPGERYLSLMAPHFYYCPPSRAVFMRDEERDFALRGKPLPPIEAGDLVRMIRDYRIRYVVVQVSSENRVNEAGRPQQLEMPLTDNRYGRHFARWLPELPVLSRDSTTVVFDANDILTRLEAAGQGR